MRRHPDEVEQMRRPSTADQVAGLALFAPLEPSEDTRRAAREAIADRAPRLRAAVLKALQAGPLTADEIAEQIGETVLATRPRVTELHQDGLVFDTGNRRPNASGRNAVVWGLKAPRKGTE